MHIDLVDSPRARQTRCWTMDLPDGATVAQALAQALDLPDFPKDPELMVSVWGRRAESDQALREGDRIELTRPLRVDPKAARRERFQKQGLRKTGLFTRRKT